MTKLNSLIAELCPDGVEHRNLVKNYHESNCEDKIILAAIDNVLMYNREFVDKELQFVAETPVMLCVLMIGEDSMVIKEQITG